MVVCAFVLFHVEREGRNSVRSHSGIPSFSQNRLRMTRSRQPRSTWNTSQLASDDSTKSGNGTEVTGQVFHVERQEHRSHLSSAALFKRRRFARTCICKPKGGVAGVSTLCCST